MADAVLRKRQVFAWSPLAAEGQVLWLYLRALSTRRPVYLGLLGRCKFIPCTLFLLIFCFLFAMWCSSKHLPWFSYHDTNSFSNHDTHSFSEHNTNSFQEVIANVPPHWNEGILENHGSRWAGQVLTKNFYYMLWSTVSLYSFCTVALKIVFSVFFFFFLS